MKELLLDAKEEIVRLRRRNEVLEAQMQIVEVFGAALFARVGREQGAAPDVVWALEKKIDELARAQPQPANVREGKG